jgi:excisionase family DNA binding protein
MSSADAAILQPDAARIPTAVALTGVSRSAIYRLASEGRIRLMKIGSRTLVDMTSLRSHLASLPTAKVRAPKEAVAS